jgi:hypothetical protein
MALVAWLVGEIPVSPESPQRRDHRCQPGYDSKANAEKSIEAIETHAAGAKVEDRSGT